jgi:hypothetical protein
MTSITKNKAKKVPRFIAGNWSLSGCIISAGHESITLIAPTIKATPTIATRNPTVKCRRPRLFNRNSSSEYSLADCHAVRLPQTLQVSSGGLFDRPHTGQTFECNRKLRLTTVAPWQHRHSSPPMQLR